MPFHASFSLGTQRNDSEAYSPFDGQHTFPERSRSIPQSLLSTKSPDLDLRLDTPVTGATSSSNLTSIEGTVHAENQRIADARKTSGGSNSEMPFSPNSLYGRGDVYVRGVLQNIEHSTSTVAFEPLPFTKSRTIPVTSAPEKKESTSWRTKLTNVTGAKKQSFATSGDTSSLSSTTLDAQTLEEISLKSLITVDKKKSGSSKKFSKHINVSLSQNSAHAIFWTQLSIHVWDIGVSPPNILRAVSAESTCVLAAVTKLYLAYIIGTRDQKLTVSLQPLLPPSPDTL
jgi:hypothetical protein